jgi:hypothetical protein
VVAEADEEAKGSDPVTETEEELKEEQQRQEVENGLKNVPPRDPNADYPGPTPQQLRDFDEIMKQLEDLGGGPPRQVNSPKGATQFIFPNGMVLRFDLEPGQYLQNQDPHINLQNAPGASTPNEHIELAPPAPQS